MPKTVEEYLSLPYTKTIRRDPNENIFVARVQELPGCSAHGESEPDALSALKDNMKIWIEDSIQSGDPVPEPAKETELPSGKWLQRVPRSLHMKLIRLAREEGVSLNQLVTSALSEAVGSREMRAVAYSCFEVSCKRLFQRNYDWNKYSLASGQFPIEIRFENWAPVEASPAGAIYLEHLANTVELSTAEHKGRRLHAEGTKQVAALQSR